ncbi:MAG: hypothetical protein AB8G18_08110 [Gammaproteobacteria bacterium]
MNPYNHSGENQEEVTRLPDHREQERAQLQPDQQNQHQHQPVGAGIESAIADHAQVSPSRVRQVVDTLKKFATVSELLRIIGAAIMVGSLSLFMMQGWLEGNDIQRYLKLLAQTLLLTAGGFGLSAWLKETKGARLFFGLSLASVAANFTILGALIYSIVQFDGMLGNYPQFAAWTSQSPSHVLLITLLAAAILIPVTRLAFTVLARPAAKWLTTTYLLGGALLLLPVRSSIWSSLLAVLLIAFIIWNISKNRGDDQTPGTTESKFSIMMLLLPPIILCVRSFYFYSVEEFALACMAAAVFLLVRQLSLRTENLTTQRFLDCVSLPLPLFTAVALTDGVGSAVTWNMQPLVFAFFLIPMMAELTLRRTNTYRSVVFGMVGALLICGALLISQVFSAGFVVAFASLAGSLLVVLTGYWLRRKATMAIGLLTALAIGVINVGNFLTWFNVNNWVLLSILGASAIILASLLDRYGAALKLRLDVLRANKARA